MFKPVIHRITQWRQRRSTIRHLRALDDRLLADMGTSRDDLACFVAVSQGATCS